MYFHNFAETQQKTKFDPEVKGQCWIMIVSDTSSYGDRHMC